jgi:small GTP-binding protein
MHKAGFVNIIGNPNVGKSTLMNALVGERLSIITSKAQTTRHRILGVVSGEDFQIVFSDTPGILKPSYKLQESMMKFVTGAVNDADVILYVTDTVEQSDRSNDILEKIRQSDIPTLAVINKIDLTTPEKLEELVDKWQALLPAATIVPVSARENFNIRGRSLLLQRYAHGQNAAILRLGNNPRKDPAQLRQGDPLLLRNRDRSLQGGTDDRPHFGGHLCRTRLPEGYPDRAQGRETQKSRTAGPRGHGAIPRQEGLPAVVRQSKRELAR